ncbi:type II toxin-antitoxin system RelE/ParE family toxin [Arthrobacter roseus]|uniref:type II toxin-antitoxin system RelE/ParE family toxin n=1 Tax=Arthrobacter roseus TaxID=136274 RepID=UPI0019650B53
MFRPEALKQVEELYDFIAGAGSPGNAEGFTEWIVSFCESRAHFSYRGVSRDDLRPALRTIEYINYAGALSRIPHRTSE